MKLLLDTHVILWSASAPENLGSDIVGDLEEPLNELWFSPISIWEILLLAERGRITVSGDVEKSIRDMVQSFPMREAPLNLEVAFQSRRIKLPHQDPADRFLAATAAVYDLILVTADSRLMHSAGFQVLPVRK